MTPEQWERAALIFEQAQSLEGPARSRFLGHACAGDEGLRFEVEEMLRCHEATGEFLDRPVLEESDLTRSDTNLERVAHFRILNKLGEGGMGTVYKAEDLKLGRTVAIKVLKTSLAGREEARARFLREARAASALDHPNICTVYEVEESENGYPAIIMAYYDGETLRQRLARGPLSPGEALRVVLQAAQGLAAAHSAGIVHRDVKPANLMVTSEGVLKILDFGIAKVRNEENVTQDSGQLGTVAYLAPEQARGEAAGPPIDIWALGLVFYELVAGANPFRQDSHLATINSILHEDPPPLQGGEGPLPVWPLIARALQKDPVQRYHTMAEFAAALEAVRDTSDGLSVLETYRRLRPAPSVAILPFANLSPEPENDSIAAGLGEELAYLLSSTPGLRVVSRSSALQSVADGSDAREVGRRLRVGAVVEGSIRRQGSRVRISVQLVSAMDGYQLWSGRYDRELHDLFDLQDEVARAIAIQLVERLEPVSRQPAAAPWDHAACAAYLRGSSQLNQWTPASLGQAAVHFREALSVAPTMTPAHFGLARTLLHKAVLGYVPPLSVLPEALAAARQAVSLDAGNASLSALVAVLEGLIDWRWGAARQKLTEIFEQHPHDPWVRDWYCEIVLLPRGRFEEALHAIGSGASGDQMFNQRLGAAWLPVWLHDPAAALEQAGECIQLSPAVLTPHWVKSLALEASGRAAEAVEALRSALVLDPASTISRALLARALACAGRRAEAEEVLAALEGEAERQYVAPSHLAWARLALGYFDHAVALLQSAVSVRDFLALYAGAYPMYAPLRGDPRFESVLDSL